MSKNLATSDDLPKLVSYKLLRETYNWPQRTLQDWIKARKFPKPLNLPGRGNYWALDDIVAWVRDDLGRASVQRPEDLEPEKVAEAATTLAARHLAEQLGRVVLPEHVVLGAVPTPAEAEAARAEQIREGERFLEQARERFAALHSFEALILVHSLLPQLRPTTRALMGQFDITIDLPDDEFQKVAISIAERAMFGTSSPENANPIEVCDHLVSDGTLKRIPSTTG